VTITNSTISGNSANGSGGGIYTTGSGTVTAKLSNTIVAGNTKSNGTTPDDIGGTVDPTSSFNLIGTGGSGGLTNGVNNNQVGIADARLAPLAFNGGTTQTMALLPGSPALDAGSNTIATNAGLTRLSLLSRTSRTRRRMKTRPCLHSTSTSRTAESLALL
jgi:predicted outer membrane repeat protein